MSMRFLSKIQTPLCRLILCTIFLSRITISVLQRTVLLDAIVAAFVLSQTLRHKNRPKRNPGIVSYENTATLLLQGWHVWAMSHGLAGHMALYLIAGTEAFYYLSRGIVHSVGVKTQTIVGL